MKEPWDWAEEDLLSLIATETKESVNLDYKESGALKNTDRCKNELSKDVSAFANSAGGTLIYGISEDGNIPTGIDAGLDPNQITKEWLEQVINSRIQRKIEGVRINQVELSTISPGRVAYVIFTPQSNRAPHQAANKKFFKRYNFESVPMEEYEIRDISTRYTSPDLMVIGNNLNSPKVIQFNSHNPLKGKYTGYNLDLGLINESIEPAHHAIISISIDSGLEFLSSRVKSSIGTRTKDNTQFAVNVFKYNYGELNKSPIFKGLNISFFDSRVIITEARGACVYSIYWSIHAPKMETKHGEFKLKVYQEKEIWFAELV